MENGNIQLQNWNKNEIEDKTFPPQQLKKVYLDEMKMQDLHKSFNRQTSDSDSEEEYSTNNMNITKTDMSTSTQNNALHIKQMTSNLSTNETYTEEMDVDSLTTAQW